MKKILMSIMVIGAMTISANAACVATGCNNVKITKLYMTATGTLYVGTDGIEANLACGGVSGKYMSLKEGDVGKNAMYSLLLTAKTTNTPVSIRVSSDAECKVIYITG